jgi:hypothetical protein
VAFIAGSSAPATWASTVVSCPEKAEDTATPEAAAATDSEASTMERPVISGTSRH